MTVLGDSQFTNFHGGEAAAIAAMPARFNNVDGYFSEQVGVQLDVQLDVQLFETDLQLIAKQGARSIVNTRPDNESEGQPLSADLARAAEEYGITFVHFPVEAGSIDAETAAAFAKACEHLKRPLIVCSRTGGQSTRIWETAESV